MKQIQKTLVLGVMAALPLGVVTAGPIAGNTSAASEIKAEEAETKSVELKVTGMTWGVGCVKKVRSALEGVEGVSKADVSMPDKAVVTAESSVSNDDLIKAGKDAGFGASVAK